MERCRLADEFFNYFAFSANFCAILGGDQGGDFRWMVYVSSISFSTCASDLAEFLPI